MSIALQKLRNSALQARRDMDPQKRAIASSTICKKIASSQHFLAATIIACYLPMRDEVDTRNVIKRAWRANKRIFVPIARNKREMLFREIRPESSLKRNSMHIWEPTDGEIATPRDLQIVITPTVAFDRHSHRIGMGGGYYDRYFAFLKNRKHWLKPKLLGVAFKCQQVEEISPNTWDIRLYRVFHE